MKAEQAVRALESVQYELGESFHWQSGRLVKRLQAVIDFIKQQEAQRGSEVSEVSDGN